MKPRRLVSTVLGAIVVLSLVAVDPAAVVLLFDIEVLSLLGSAGAMLTLEQGRAWVRYRWARVRCAPSVVIFCAGLRLTRADPRSVLAA